MRRELLVVFLGLIFLGNEIAYSDSQIIRRVISPARISVFKYLEENEGKAFSFSELWEVGFSEEDLSAQLKELVASGKIVEIAVSAEIAREQYQGNIYLLPRRNLIDPELIERIDQVESSDSPNSMYFTYARSYKQFLQDLKRIYAHWVDFYERFGTQFLEKFRGYFFPEVVHILGDDLEAIQSRLFQIKQKLLIEIDMKGEMNNQELDNFFSQQLEGLRKNVELRESYKREHDVVGELDEIIAILRENLPSLVKIGEEYGDELLGLAIIGSWARATPNQTTDIDFLPISENGIKVEFARELGEKIKVILGNRVKDVHNLQFFQLIMNQPATFWDVFNFDEAGDFQLYVRNFIVVSKDTPSLIRINGRITSVNPLINAP